MAEVCLVYPANSKQPQCLKWGEQGGEQLVNEKGMTAP